MNLTSGIIEVDLHGLRTEEAIKRAKSEVNKASGSVYIIRLIHGYHGGTRIREAIEDEFSYSDHKEGPFGRIPYDALAARIRHEGNHRRWGSPYDTRIQKKYEVFLTYGREEKVKKIRQGSNPGITELVLREI